MPATQVEQAAVERTFRREFGRAVATLVRLLGDIDLAEEAVQDAFVVALRRWPTAGIPPNPGGWIALNRAVAVAEVHGPELALATVDGLDLDTYHLFHATRADLLRRLGRRAEAVEAYDAALRLTANVAERRFLDDRRRSVSP